MKASLLLANCSVGAAPSLSTIRTLTHHIRQGWSNAERRRRAELARLLQVVLLCGAPKEC